MAGIDWDHVLNWCGRSPSGNILTVQWVSWRYGTHLMEEWEMARWRSRAALHFLGSLYAPELEYRYLGGQKDIFENGVRILERLEMINPPRATDLRLSKLGHNGGMCDSDRRVWERMDRREDGGWHVSGYAVCRDNRPPDLILFCTRERGWRMGGANDRDAFQHRCAVSPKQRAIRLRIPGKPSAARRTTRRLGGGSPPRSIWHRGRGTVSAWALDFSRGSYYYRLEGDRELPVQRQLTRKGEVQSQF